MIWFTSLFMFGFIATVTTDPQTEGLAVISFVSILLLPLFNSEPMNED